MHDELDKFCYSLRIWKMPTKMLDLALKRAAEGWQDFRRAPYHELIIHAFCDSSSICFRKRVSMTVIHEQMMHGAVRKTFQSEKISKSI